MSDDVLIPGRFAERVGQSLADAGVPARSLPRATRLIVGEFAPDLANGLDVDDDEIADEVVKLKADLPGMFEAGEEAPAGGNGRRSGRGASSSKEQRKAEEEGRAMARKMYPDAFDEKGERR